MKHKIIKKTLLTIGISLSIVNSHLSIAQRSLGVSGLLNIPSADMQEDGTFMAGGNYLPQEMLPQEWGYNSGNYFVNLTFLPFMEVAYRCTLLKVESTGKWNQDRSVSLRLRPLKEGKWWPSVVIGSNDLLTTGELNPFLDSGGNRYFSSVYAVGTKHFGFYGHDIGVTVGGHVPFRSRSENKGVFGGVSYRPAFLKPLEVMAEYDSKAVNMGVSARLFDHFSLYAYCYDFKTVAGGIRYELTPRQRVFNPNEVRMPWDGRVGAGAVSADLAEQFVAGQDIRGGDQYRSGGGGAALERGGFHGAGDPAGLEQYGRADGLYPGRGADLEPGVRIARRGVRTGDGRQLHEQPDGGGPETALCDAG